MRVAGKRVIPALLPLCLAATAWAQPAAPDSRATVVRGVVVTAAPRQKPVGAPPPLEAYATPPRIEQIALSPDGGQIAYVAVEQDARVLVAYRLADRTRRMVRLSGEEISSLAFAGPDHVLISTTRSALRGTCNATDERAIQINVLSDQIALRSVAGGLASSNPDQDDMRAALQSLSPTALRPCVYYGVRAQSAVTSVDLNLRRGRDLGLHLGDIQSLPLGPPVPVVLGGEPRLAGPFLELRDRPQGAGLPVERVFLWSVDPRTGGGRLLDDGGGDRDRATRYVDDWLLGPKGVVVARSLYDFPTRRFSVQIRAGGAWTSVLSREIPAKGHVFAPYLIGLGADGVSLVILDQVDAPSGPAAHYYAVGPDGRRSGPLEPDDALSDRPLFDPASGRLDGFVRTGETDTYALADPDLQALYQKAQDAVPGETVRIAAVADDPRRMLVYAQGRDDPGGYDLLDFATGQSTVIGDDYPLIPSAWLAPQSRVSYPAADGLQIPARLTLPPVSPGRDLPLIVIPHDGLQAHGRDGFDWLAQALASRGYVVLQPDVRGSDGHGPALLQAGDGQLGGKAVSDLVDGVSSLSRQGLVDPARVCVLGLGWGGYQALVAAATRGAPWRCAGSINGVADLAAMAAWLKRWQARPDQDEITPLVADPATPRAFMTNPASPRILARHAGDLASAPSPIRRSGALALPVLLVDAEGDRIVPARQTRALRDALQAAGKSVEWVAFKSADHDLASRAARLATLTAVMDFLAKHNPAD